MSTDKSYIFSEISAGYYRHLVALPFILLALVAYAHLGGRNGYGRGERHARLSCLARAVLYTGVVVRVDYRIYAGACQINLLVNFVFASV
jgi:hypothetical protein